MSWLARLKTGKAPEKDVSKTTETLFVVSVAPTLAPLQKNVGATVAANDPAPTPMTALVDIGTVRPPGLSPSLLAASLALDASIVAEIDLFAMRLHKFGDRGLARTDREALADKLVIRDRESDDRHVCMECNHFAGHGASSWRCGNWLAADVAIRLSDAKLPVDLVVQLQRCHGFTVNSSIQHFEESEVDPPS